jgi:hypothetical protein
MSYKAATIEAPCITSDDDDQLVFVCLFVEFALTNIMLRQTLGFPATREGPTITALIVSMYFYRDTPLSLTEQQSS